MSDLIELYPFRKGPPPRLLFRTVGLYSHGIKGTGHRAIGSRGQSQLLYLLCDSGHEVVMCRYTSCPMPVPRGAIYLDYSVNDFFRPAASNLAFPGLDFHNLGGGGWGE